MEIMNDIVSIKVILIEIVFYLINIIKDKKVTDKDRDFHSTILHSAY